MNKDSVRWASLAFIMGGLLMAVVWIIYTGVHGPTSYDETGVVLGRSSLFWSLLLSVPPNLLVALGLIFLYARFFSRAGRPARVGYVLTLMSLVVPAGADLFVWGGIGPPFFVPILGIGLILLAQGDQPKQIRYLLILLGILLMVAFAWALVPLEVSDQVGGYRWFGLFAHLLPGLGWVMLGVSFWKTPAPIVSAPT
jgi:hypothetical protein